MNKDGFDTSKELKWGFFFVNWTKEELEKVYDELKEKSYKLENLAPLETGEWQLQVSKIDILTPEKLHRRNLAFNELAEACDVDTYDGWDVEKIEKDNDPIYERSIPIEKEMEAILALDADERYDYSICKMAELGKVWGLGNKGGFHTYGGDNDETYVAVWPFKEYAQLCAVDAYKGSVSISIDIHEFIEEYIPDIRQANFKLSIFPLPSGIGIPTEIDEFLHDIQIELDRVK